MIISRMARPNESPQLVGKSKWRVIATSVKNLRQPPYDS